MSVNLNEQQKRADERQGAATTIETLLADRAVWRNRALDAEAQIAILVLRIENLKAAIRQIIDDDPSS